MVAKEDIEIDAHLTGGERARKNLYIFLMVFGTCFIISGLVGGLVSSERDGPGGAGSGGYVLVVVMILIGGLLIWWGYSAKKNLEDVVVYRIHKKKPKYDRGAWKEEAIERKSVHIKKDIHIKHEDSSSKKKHCTHCGAMMPAHAKFCPDCGKKQ